MMSYILTKEIEAAATCDFLVPLDDFGNILCYHLLRYYRVAKRDLCAPRVRGGDSVGCLPLLFTIEGSPTQVGTHTNEASITI